MSDDFVVLMEELHVASWKDFPLGCILSSSCGITDREADGVRVVAVHIVDELHERLVILRLLF